MRPGVVCTSTTASEVPCPIYRHDLPVFPYTTVASTFPGSERLFRTDCEPNKVSSQEQARDTHKDKKIDKKQKILNKKHNFYSRTTEREVLYETAYEHADHRHRPRLRRRLKRRQRRLPCQRPDLRPRARPRAGPAHLRRQDTTSSAAGTGSVTPDKVSSPDHYILTLAGIRQSSQRAGRCVSFMRSAACPTVR